MKHRQDKRGFRRQAIAVVLFSMGLIDTSGAVDETTDRLSALEPGQASFLRGQTVAAISQWTETYDRAKEKGDIRDQKVALLNRAEAYQNECQLEWSPAMFIA